MSLSELTCNGAWCPYPWSDLSSDTGGRYKLCGWSTAPLPYRIANVSPLEHWNSAEMREVRRAMLLGDRGVAGKYCETCRLEEAAGAESPRLRRIKELTTDQHYFDEMTKAVAATIAAGDGTATANYFHRVDLRVAGNLCNLRCVMCSPQSSSSIAQEMKRTGRLSQEVPTFTLPIQEMAPGNREQFWRELEEVLPHTRCLYFAGGEPFLSEAHYQVLDLAIRQGLTRQISLMYSTNLTCLKTATGRVLTDYLNQFARVKLLASVDNLYAKNDYIRHGSKFSEFVENLHVICQTCPHVEIEPATCVSILNILDLAEIYAFFRAHCRSHSFINLLVHPPVLRATNLPAELKPVAIRRLSQFPELFGSQIRWLESPAETDVADADLSAFADYVAQIDQARGTNFRAIFPEFGPHLDSAARSCCREATCVEGRAITCIA